MRIPRRQFLTGLLGAAAFAGTSARAARVCQPYDDVEVCEVGLQFDPAVTTAQQECIYWCWAACVESIFALNGYAVSQAEIVQRVYDAPVCAPAVGAVIAAAASGEWMTGDGRRFSTSTDVLIDADRGIWRADAAEIAGRELTANRPLIVGALGHAVLLTAVTFAQDAYGNYRILQCVVRDPWPTSPNRRVLTEAEAQQMFFLAAVQAV